MGSGPAASRHPGMTNEGIALKLLPIGVRGGQPVEAWLAGRPSARLPNSRWYRQIPQNGQADNRRKESQKYSRQQSSETRTAPILRRTCITHRVRPESGEGHDQNN